MGANDLAPEPDIEQFRYAASVIDMGVGQKQIVYFDGRHGKLGKGQDRIVAGQRRSLPVY